MYQSIKSEVQGAAAIISLNRPDSLNAFTYPMIQEFRHALAQAEENEAVFGIVITGEGRGFCAGMDMNALNTQANTGEQEGAGSLSADLSASPGDASMGDDFKEGFTYMMTIRKPIIAAVNGACAGLGMSVALLCDLRFAADTAKFVTSFSQRGLVAEHGQSWILPRVVGPSRALDLFWSSRRLMAEEAREMGMVDRVYPAEKVVSAALDYINELSKTTAPVSIMTMKQQVYRQLNMTLGEAMDETNRLMNESLVRDDFKEGVASFLEKRPPEFARIKID